MYKMYFKRAVKNLKEEEYIYAGMYTFRSIFGITFNLYDENDNLVDTMFIPTDCNKRHKKDIKEYLFEMKERYGIDTLYYKDGCVNDYRYSEILKDNFTKKTKDEFRFSRIAVA